MTKPTVWFVIKDIFSGKEGVPSFLFWMHRVYW